MASAAAPGLASAGFGLGFGVVAGVAESLAVGDGVGSAFGDGDDVVCDGGLAGVAVSADRVAVEDGSAEWAGEALACSGPAGVHR